MKKTSFLIAIAAVAAYTSCTKTTNNYTTTNKTTIDTLVTGQAQPAFMVNGIHDLDFVNGSISFSSLPLTIQYADSAQQVVTLSLSALPKGISMDSSWTTSGIPTYNATLSFFDTTANGATLGTFPMTLTATGAITGAKTYQFNIKITQQPPCTGPLMGKYTNCSNTCGSSSTFSDSVYADPNINNKIWFTNFDGLGIKLFGLYNCNSNGITIPAQTVGGITYNGSGDGFSSGGAKSMFINVSMSNGDFCEINMN